MLFRSQVKERAYKSEYFQKNSGIGAVKQQCSDGVPEAEKYADGKYAQYQTVVNGRFDGPADTFPVSYRLVFRDAGQEHDGDGIRDGRWEHDHGQRHSGQNPVQAQGG